jgi:hypothetical protein
LGELYTVDFYVKYGGAGEGDADAYLTMSAGAGSKTLTDTASGSWTLYTFTFTGTGSDTLTIAAQTNPSDWFVDDISVVGNGLTATPLPAALPLFAGGLGLLGMFVRRKKRSGAAVLTAD